MNTATGSNAQDHRIVADTGMFVPVTTATP